jgi:hypothetical protein
MKRIQQTSFPAPLCGGPRHGAPGPLGLGSKHHDHRRAHHGAWASASRLDPYADDPLPAHGWRLGLLDAGAWCFLTLAVVVLWAEARLVRLVGALSTIIRRASP